MPFRAPWSGGSYAGNSLSAAIFEGTRQALETSCGDETNICMYPLVI